ncbi:hypothetical protein CVT24_004500 [Panaeolus cyanescens]|uniref:SWI/SNF and RSC complexes subunit ssr4 n=1 Tax=Panaeolus cyanescens TaxID=181874 RepID=A0A409YBR7_9AGAR|nr:hypothetical protein CVT24_004500 [Panaeolus cyanescens]
MSAAFLQAQQEGLCLRYPEPIAPQREMTLEHAMNLLMRATTHAQNVPFTWSYIDKPQDGTVLLLYLGSQSAFPNDGIRYQEPETRMTVPMNIRELEVHEVKYGFIPGSTDTSASRFRRRYRIVKGGNPSLVLVHYTRGPATHIQPQLMNQPVRTYPLRMVNEPAVYVVGEKAGQKAMPPGQGGIGGGSGMPPNMISIGNMSMSQQHAMLAQQNNQMESLERRRERERAMRERSASNAGRPPPPGQPQSRMDDDDSGDEVDQISSRTLASARYKRNHDWMNEVFFQAAFGDKTPPAPKPAYSIFSKTEIEEKTKKLEADIEALQLRASQRHAARVRETQGGDIQMSSAFGEPVAS